MRYLWILTAVLMIGATAQAECPRPRYESCDAVFDYEGCNARNSNEQQRYVECREQERQQRDEAEQRQQQAREQEQRHEEEQRQQQREQEQQRENKQW
jgi:hypothetical protein